MSRRIRVNLTRWVCRKIGHDFDYPNGRPIVPFCLRCGRF